MFSPFILFRCCFPGILAYSLCSRVCIARRFLWPHVDRAFSGLVYLYFSNYLQLRLFRQPHRFIRHTFDYCIKTGAAVIADIHDGFSFECVTFLFNFPGKSSRPLPSVDGIPARRSFPLRRDDRRFFLQSISVNITKPSFPILGKTP